MRPITVPDPLLGEIDITDVAPIVDTTDFQRLRRVKQLGTTINLYPNATHNRFGHCIGAYHRTKMRLHAWRDTPRALKKKGVNVLSPQEERDVIIYALIHDIGHGPLSHIIEDVTTLNHEQNGQALIRHNIKNAIRASHGNPTKIYAMLGKQDPLGRIVDDKVLGSEKWDYLERDLHFTGAGIMAPPHLKEIEKHVIWYDNRIMIDSEVVHAVRNLIVFYWNAYKDVYFSPKALFYQRLFQKMIHTELATHAFTEHTLWNLNDGELEGRLKLSNNKDVRKLFAYGAERKLHRALVLRLAPYLHEEQCEKNVYLRAGTRPLLTAFEDRTAGELETIEHNIARIAHLPPADILFVPVTKLGHKRFSPHSTPILLRNLKDTVDLFDHYADMRPLLTTYEESFLALRIFCNQTHMQTFLRHAREIEAFLSTFV
ncbi:MAG: HD domain-containing protein [Patescibacteria group bacterium]|nr:HD domain-containing protein [Patescibacteria group bacterium]MDE2438099.1 HD domain-containing protein [Patescibacteria group bacterium]